METKRIFQDDLKIAEALIHRDEGVTRHYFYQQCYPLFKSVFDNFFTDCVTVKEFIDEIYIVVLAPGKKTGKCQMENFKGESSLAAWLKSACLFYCYRKFKHRIVVVDKPPTEDDDSSELNDRLIDINDSCDIDLSNMNHEDVEAILSLMPNKRYAELIRLRYLEMMTNEETAKAMALNMDNYYNVQHRAKSQYVRVCKEEEEYHG